ncbi:hypothetical protein BH11CYA1_BH11CYA1_10420 [soil metagenome]
MTKQVAENFNSNSSDSLTANSTLSESVQSSMTLADIKTILAKKIQPADTCILDREGYIACGPIVGSARPEKPGSVVIIEVAPHNPSFDKFPPNYEKPEYKGETKVKPGEKLPHLNQLDKDAKDH